MLGYVLSAVHQNCFGDLLLVRSRPRVRPFAGPRINSGRCPWLKWAPTFIGDGEALILRTSGSGHSGPTDCPLAIAPPVGATARRSAIVAVIASRLAATIDPIGGCQALANSRGSRSEHRVQPRSVLPVAAAGIRHPRATARRQQPRRPLRQRERGRKRVRAAPRQASPQ